MARRSLLFSKKRSSKAILNKKRKADRELQQTCSPKRTRSTYVRDDEEDVEDFIVVDTGTLYEPKKANQRFAINKDEEVIPNPHGSSTRCTPELAMEDKEVVVETTPKISWIDSDVAQKAKNALLVLDPALIEPSEGEGSRGQSLELKENKNPSGSKDDPILVSALPTTDEESPRSRSTTPEPVQENLESSISSPLAPVLGTNTPSTLESEEARAEYQNPYQPLTLPLDSLKPSSVEGSGTQPGSINSSTPPATQHIEPVILETFEPARISDTPLRVLVTKGDQCPSKFVVSSIAINSEAAQQTPPEVGPQARNAWIETVTEARTNSLPKLSESRISGLSISDTRGLGISKILQADPELARQVSTQKFSNLEPSTTILQDTEDLKSPPRPKKSGKIWSHHAQHDSTEVHSQTLKQGEIPISVPDIEIVTARNRDQRKAPFLIQYPKLLPEASAISEPSLPGETANKEARVWSTKVSCLDAPLSSQRVDPSVSPPSPNQSPPLLKFTFDNRAESPLTQVEVQRFVQTFVKDAIALIPTQHSAQPKSYPAGVIMWQSLQKFYKWHAKEEKKQMGTSVETTAMKFELLDVHWQPEKVFLLSRNSNLDEFRALKQCIWDLFWLSTNLNAASCAFRIMITRAPEIVNEADFGRLTAVKSTISSQTTNVFSIPPPSHSDFDNAILAINFGRFERESAQHQHQLPSTCLPPLLPTAPPVTLDIEGAKTPQFLWDFVQKSYRPVTGLQPHPNNTSPPRPGNHESSALQTDLPPPSPVRPDKNFTAVTQLPVASPPILAPSVNNNLGSQYHLPPPVHSTTRVYFPLSSRTHLFSYQNHQANTNIQLPSPRPSPVMADTNKTQPPQSSIKSAENNYAANTARPLFAMPPQKEPTVHRILLPSIHPTRATNTAQLVRDPQSPQNTSAPNKHKAMETKTTTPMPQNPSISNKHKDIQTEITPPITQTSRTPGETQRLRDKALQMIANRPDLLLEPTETTGGRKRTYPEISGVIVDKASAQGIVIVTERGYPLQQVDTGQDVYVDQYVELTLSDGQSCVIHGSSTVLYYKMEAEQRPMGKGNESERQRQRTPLPSQAQEPRQLSTHMAEDAQLDTLNQPPLPPSAAEIKIRVQVDVQGHFSPPHDFSVFDLAGRVEFFFSWFGKHTGRGGDTGPERLRFLLKDAMPDAKVYDIGRENNGTFLRMVFEVLRECEKAKGFMPGLREFGVLVVDPQWKEGIGQRDVM